MRFDKEAYTRLESLGVRCLAEDPEPGSGLTRADCRMVARREHKLVCTQRSPEHEAGTSAQCRVIARIDVLPEVIRRLALSGDVARSNLARSLEAKSKAALAQWARGHTETAAAVLTALIAEVDAQSEKALSARAAILLRAEALDLIGQLKQAP